MWRKGNPCTVGRNANWFSYYGKQVWSFLKKFKTELYDTAIPLLGIYINTKTSSKRFMHPYTYCRIINNSQHMETT